MGRKKKIIETVEQVVDPVTPDTTPEVKPDPIPAPTPDPTPEVLPEITSSNDVKSKLADIGSTVQKVQVKNIEKGVGIEEQIKILKAGGVPVSTTPTVPTPVKREGRGRHPKDCKCEKCLAKSPQIVSGEAVSGVEEELVRPTSAKFDTIALLVNSTVVPIVSKRFKKDATQVMLQKDQIDHLLTIKPESTMDKPSWVNYSITAVSMLVMNFMTADSSDNKDIKVVNESVKIFSKMKPEDQEIYLELLTSKKKKDEK